MRSRSRAGIAAVLLVCTAALYLPRLGSAPRYVQRDEVRSAIIAHAIASDGRDPNGRLLPLLFYPGNSVYWSAPMVMIYGVAPLLRVLPFSEATIRMPMALAGIADVLLVYAIGLLLFDDALFAAAGAVLVALTPGHFMLARRAIPALLPVPFVLAALACVLYYERRRSSALLAASGVFLVVGTLSYLGTTLLLPIFVALTVALLYWWGARPSAYAALGIGVAAPAAAVAAWLAAHSTALDDVLFHYEWAGTARMALGARVANVARLYAGFWSPAFLFIDGPPRIEYGTRTVGLFLLPTAGLFAVGIVSMLRRATVPIALVLACLIVSPLPASLVGEARANWRAATVLPFVALVAAAGFQAIRASGSPRGRRAAFAAAFGITVLVAAVSHGRLPHAQALFRASALPFAIAAAALVLDRVSVNRTEAVRSAVLWLAMLAIAQVALAFATSSDVATATAVVVPGVALVALASDATLNRLKPGIAGAGALLAVVASAAMYAYIERVPMIPHVPLRAIFATARFLPAAAALAVALWLFTASRLNVETNAGVAKVGALALLVAAQASFFFVDAFESHAARIAQMSFVLVSAMGLAVYLRGRLADAAWLGSVAAVALLTIGGLQFVQFAQDYFGPYQTRDPGAEGQLAQAIDRVIDRIAAAPHDAMFVDGVDGEALWWRYCAIKRGREDLIPRRVRLDRVANVERLRQLPAGSVILVRSKPGAPVQSTMTEGAFVLEEVVTTAEGGAFQILERTGA